MERKEIALRLGGDGLAKLLYHEIMVKEDENGIKIIEKGAGFAGTLDFMIRLSVKQDMIIEELLPVIPTFVCFSEFIRRMEWTKKVTAEEFEKLLNKGHIL